MSGSQAAFTHIPGGEGEAPSPGVSDDMSALNAKVP